MSAFLTTGLGLPHGGRLPMRGPGLFRPPNPGPAPLVIDASGLGTGGGAGMGARSDSAAGTVEVTIGPGAAASGVVTLVWPNQPPASANGIWASADWASVTVNGPSYAMDFISNPGTLPAGVVFTRASTATYFDQTGTMRTAMSGAPRWDYDPVTHQLRGLLIEEARTNLNSTSADQTSGGYGSNPPTNDVSTVRPSGVLAPDGTDTATKIIANPGLGGHIIYYIFSGAVSTTYTLSTFVRAAGCNFVGLGLENSGFPTNQIVMFNLSTGAISSNPSSIPAGIIPIGNGWYRCWITATSLSSAGAYVATMYPSSTNNSFSTGDGVSGVLSWGWQIEAGAFPTSYIPTTGVNATRAADVASMPVGTWFSTQFGTLQAEIYKTMPLSGASQVSAGIGDDNFNNAFYMVDGGLNRIGVGTAAWPSPTVFPSTNKYAGTYAATGITGSGNASAPSTAAGNATLPTALRLSIGCDPWIQANQMDGYIRRVTYWPRALSNAELIAVTSLTSPSPTTYALNWTANRPLIAGEVVRISYEWVTAT